MSGADKERFGGRNADKGSLIRFGNEGGEKNFSNLGRTMNARKITTPWIW